MTTQTLWTPIASTPNGWHTIRLFGYGFPGGYVIAKYRTQRVRCCGASITVADGERPALYIDNAWTPLATARGEVKQCRGCGSLYAGRFRAWETESPHSTDVSALDYEL